MPARCRRRRAACQAAVWVQVLYAAHGNAAAAEEPRFAPWQPLFQGVEGAAGAVAAPRPQAAYAVRIDLQHPAVRLLLTPGNGDAPGETTSQTASEFLTHHKLQAAVNAHFYGPCCAATPEGKDLVGLAIAAGVEVSAAATQGTGVQVLLIDADRRVRLAATSRPVDLQHVEIALAGSHRLLCEGQSVAPADGEGFLGPHPRTAMGTTADGRYLVWLVIDGRQPGYSEGATLRETAEWLLRAGVADGLNLDGGGSTELVTANAAGQPRLLNRPVGRGTAGSERLNGSHLGVFAPALPSDPP
jgi:hypothetical protein